jgi:hypothetical protein
MLVLGDFNTHSQSWGCESDDNRACVVHNMFYGLRLVHSNDGSLTRKPASLRRSSAINLTLCSADVALIDILWQVLDDASGSDHLPILTSLQSFHVPTNIPVPIFNLTRHRAWSTYAKSVLERYDIYVNIILESTMAAQTGYLQRYLSSCAINVV